MDKVKIHIGDCLEVLKTIQDSSVDSIVTDPPYGLSFMGKKWDYDVPTVSVWEECLRVLKPGGHLLAFAGTRTQHRMAVRIEDAGFEIRDMIAWVYGSGFPKSLDVSKAIDKRGGASVAWFGPWFRKWREDNGVTQKQVAALFPSKTGNITGCVANWELGFNMPTPEQFNLIRDTFGLPFASVEEAEREVVGKKDGYLLAFAPGQDIDRSATTLDITAPATDAARQWQGWGTAMKPALETVTFASKPYTDEQVRDIIRSNLFRLEARLWLLSSANAAGKSSTSNQSEYGAACAIAQWNADEITSTRADLCGQMGTSLFALATTTSLNIVSSWRRTLDESWSDGSTSTIETKSSTTIDWRTLKFSVSQITPASIIKACSLPGGFSANASTAESHFNASLLLLQSILTLSVTEPVISLAQHEHQGAGVTPNLDPVVLARKPLAGTVAENVLAHGTGALNIDGCRVGGMASPSVQRRQGGAPKMSASMYRDAAHNHDEKRYEESRPGELLGRWPANLIHDGSPEVLAGFPQAKGQQGALTGAEPSSKTANAFGEFAGRAPSAPRGDTGSAARFFYCAKASESDREEGIEGIEGIGALRDSGRGSARHKNRHPTVKPTDLMRYLVRLVTPPGGVVLDPFMGSGSTGKASVLEGFSFIGIEREAEYFEIAESRISFAAKQGVLI